MLGSQRGDAATRSRAVGRYARHTTMDLDTCSQCGWRREPGVAACPQCGVVFPPAAAGPRDLRLTTLGQDVPDQSWLVSQDDAVIGRDEGAAISIPHGWVSREHARIVRAPDGFRIQDVGSKNGTFVNDRPATVSTLLLDGDTISVGGIHLVANLVSAGAGPPPEDSREVRGTLMVNLTDALATMIPVVLVAPAVEELAEATEAAADVVIEVVAHAAEQVTEVVGPAVEPVVEMEDLTTDLSGSETDPYGTIASLAIKSLESEAPPAWPSTVAADSTAAVDEAPDTFSPDAPLVNLAGTAAILAGGLAALNVRLSEAFDAFDQAGGLPALAELIAELRRAEASGSESTGSPAQAESALRFLAAERLVFDALRPPALDSGGLTADGEVQGDGPDDEPVA